MSESVARLDERLKHAAEQLERFDRGLQGVSRQLANLATGKGGVFSSIGVAMKRDHETLDSKHLKQADGFGHAVDLVPWVAGAARWEWGAIWPIAAAVRQAGPGDDQPAAQPARAVR